MRIVAKTREALIAIGWAYLALLWFAFLFGSLSIADRGGLTALASALSPLNVDSWLVTGIALAPGIALLVAGYWKPPGR